MTDNEIIKALECCTINGASCKDCPAFVKVDRSNCKKYFRGALDLINHQKAEIERLRQTYPHNRYPVCVKVRNGEIYTHTLYDYDWLIGDISAEAIKEFAERLKIRFSGTLECSGEVIQKVADDLVKEMIGDNK